MQALRGKGFLEKKGWVWVKKGRREDWFSSQAKRCRRACNSGRVVDQETLEADRTIQQRSTAFGQWVSRS